MKQLLKRLLPGGDIPTFTGKNFNDAFAKARKVLGVGKQFKFGKGVYGTSYKDEILLPQRIIVDPEQMPGLREQLITTTRSDGPGRVVIDEKLGFVGQFGNLFTLPQAQQVIDAEGGKGLMHFEDENGNWVRVGEGFKGKNFELRSDEEKARIITLPFAEKQREALLGDVVAPGQWNNNYVDVVGAGLPEINVKGHLTNIKPNTAGFTLVNRGNKDTELGYDTFNKIYKSDLSDDYYMVDPVTGQVLRSAPDARALKDASLWTNYHTGLNGDVNLSKDSFDLNQGGRTASRDRLDRENRESNSELHDVYDSKGNYIGKSGKLTTKQVTDGIKEAHAKAINLPLTVINIPNHIAMGLAKTAFDDNYTMNDYLKSFTQDQILNGEYQINGLGDVFDILDPRLRNAANFVNTYSILSTANAARNFSIKGGNLGTRTVDIKPVETTVAKGTGKVTGGNVVRSGGTSAGRFGNSSGWGRQGGRMGPQHNWRGALQSTWGTTKAYGPSTLELYYTTPIEIDGTLPVPYTHLMYENPREFGSTIMADPVTFDYKSGISNPYQEDLIINGVNHANLNFGGGVAKDESPNSSVTVHTSTGNTNNARSKGRSGNTNKHSKSTKAKTGVTDRSE